MDEIILDDYMELIRNHAKVGLRYMRHPTIYTLDDMIQEGIIAFMKAKRTDKKKSSFKTWLTTCLRSHYYSMMIRSFKVPQNNGIKPNRVFRHQIGIPAMVDHASAIINYNLNDGMNSIRGVDSMDSVESLINALTGDELAYVMGILSNMSPREIRSGMKIGKSKENRIRKYIAEKIIKLGIR